ncbi:MAG: DUF2334 domain-containing protein [Lachnospiraceae bacterium]|nr:DUF2334 domain-containing protein [Lachnospiraceae bacterium]
MSEKRLLFRLDDIAPGMVRTNLDRLKTIFDKYDIKPLLGVVPDNKDPGLVKDEKDEENFWKNIKKLEEEGWPIAMHGSEHVYCTEDSGLLRANPFSEFAGLSFEAQKEKLVKGRNALEKHDIKPVYFMAPGHTFDENTLKALHETGFTYVTDGYTAEPYRREDLLFIPCTLGEAQTPKGTDTVCIHLNNWKDEDFERLEDFLKDDPNVCGTWTGVVNNGASDYGKKTAKEEKRYIRIRDMKRRSAESEVMQRYMRKSYSDNKAIKLIKRVFYLPMLLGKK